MKSSLVLLISTLFCFALLSSCRTAEEWKSRVIYQLLTDRFARTDGDATPCSDLNKYCGGTFKGIQNNLDYIEEAGFNAIWISPVVENTENGYHGYWTKDLYKINEHFGTEQDLHDLINACHERDIWVMMDVIANHVGYVNNNDFSTAYPFTDLSFYNENRGCETISAGDEYGFENCWLAGLPDLNQNNPFVRKTLIDWIKNFVQTYHVDGLRLDALKHVSRSFWKEFSDAAGVFTIGELFDYDLPYLASYQGSVDSVLNFPLLSTMKHSFGGGSMRTFEYYYNGAYATWKDITVLGNFVDNHDIARFLNNNGNVAGFKSALAFSICSVGIPTFYYGDEQGFGGGADPDNREALWVSGMNRDNEFFQFVKKINTFRKNSAFYKEPQVQRYADDNVYAFTRGDHLFAFTNSMDFQQRTITYHPYAEGTRLCNVMFPKDCVEVVNGEIQLVLIGGEVKILSPSVNTDSEAPISNNGNAWKKIKSGFAENLSLGIRRMSSRSRDF